MRSNEQLWQQAILNCCSTIQQAIRNLDQTGIKIALVVDAEGKFEGTISDGDIRRALLKGLGLEDPISSVVHRNAVVVPPGMSREMVIQLMSANKVQQIPVIDGQNLLIGLHLWDEVSTPATRSTTMVIMAGGRGTRLKPYTEDCPKPMLLIGSKPMLEHIILRAKHEGFNRFVLAIHYLGHMVEDYFGDGSKWNVRIDYLRESMPLGTAGALSLLSKLPSEPFLVTNGDVVTDIRYGELLDFHVAHEATATMAVRTHEWQHPFGVVHIKGVDIIGFEEKPISRSHINAGVYALNPEVLAMLNVAEHCDMPTLFERVQKLAGKTIVYPMHENWMDVGRPDDLILANTKTVK